MTKKRGTQSMVLIEKLSKDVRFEYELYMDLVYEQTLYEINNVYEVAFYDAASLFMKLSD